MCRNIKTLRSSVQPPTEEEVKLAALQFVRKVSGYRSPSKANQQAFDAAVDEITEATQRLLDRLVVVSAPRRSTTTGAETRPRG